VSLTIDIDVVTHVLLADGAWYEAANGSFNVDAYELVWRSGHEEASLHSAPGFTFTDTSGRTISGPISSVMAVQAQAS
jgi:hypothetical protein